MLEISKKLQPYSDVDETGVPKYPVGHLLTRAGFNPALTDLAAENHLKQDPITSLLVVRLRDGAPSGAR